MQSPLLKLDMVRSCSTEFDATWELTEAGRAFLQKAREVLATAQSAELALIEFSDLKRGVLSVQASQTIASYWLPRHLVAFRRAYPLIDIHLDIGNTARVVAAIENGSAELGFVEGAFHSEQLARSPVAQDQLIVVVAPEHELATRKQLTPADLSKVDWGTARARIRYPVGFRGRAGPAWSRSACAARIVGVAFK